ncbi:MAG: Single-stranded-D-specific exonuclease RecJ, partial [Evtepia sp.]|nr:Single-stranded-D-specific exonuclease RecJ [Evtepia sp.]
HRVGCLVTEDTGGEEVISTLDVDVEITDVFSLTVDEVGQLSMLEPYGNGNPKPVFSLTGAVITCMADVGGGRHLKMRVCRDGRTLDAIFFSTTRVQSGMQVGDRVDLAFYPQINEYRDTRAVQLHLVDIRRSEVSEHESEERLYQRFCQGHTLPRKVAGYMIPQRDEFKALWRYLSGNGGVTEDTPESLARNIAQDGERSVSVTRTMICLQVLEECGLVHMERREGHVKIRTHATKGEKMDLEQTSLMRRLRKMAGQL